MNISRKKDELLWAAFGWVDSRQLFDQKMLFLRYQSDGKKVIRVSNPGAVSKHDLKVREEAPVQRKAGRR